MTKLSWFCVALCTAGCGDNSSGSDFGTGGNDLAHAHADLSSENADLAQPSGVDLAMSADLSSVTSADLSTVPTNDLSSTTGSFGTIFTVVLENQNYADIVGSSNAPYLNSLINSYGLATNYSDSGSHPSLPNYLYMISGNAQYPGGIDLLPTDNFLIGQFPVDMDNLGNQMQQAGVAWRSYQESMGTACKLTNSGNYAPKHDPFLYFKDIQNGANNLCATTNVDFDQNFSTDLAAGTYRYMWITPNLIDDGHNPTNDPVTGLMDADNWMKKTVPMIMASNAYKNNGVIFITWDEAEDGSGHIPMIVISPRLKQAGFMSNTKFSHASYLATVEDIFKLPRLGDAQNATSLMEFFK